MKAKLHIDLPEDDKNRIKLLATSQGQTIKTFVLKAIEHYALHLNQEAKTNDRPDNQ